MRDINVGDVYETNTGSHWEVVDINKFPGESVHALIKFCGKIFASQNGIENNFWISCESHFFKKRIFNGLTGMPEDSNE